jgi:hypothetical protein
LRGKLDWLKQVSAKPGAAQLDLFPEKELEQHYAMGIQRRLWRIFGPDVVPEPVKVKRQPKLTRPLGISEQSWNDVIALRKKPKPASGRSRPAPRMAA